MHAVAVAVAQLNVRAIGGLGEARQPVPDSNFVSEENSAVPQAAKRYVPSRFSYTASGERALGRLASQHVVLGRGELRAPLRSLFLTRAEG
jgi:hypothetical protein